MDTRTADHAKARIRKQVNHYKELVANMTSMYAKCRVRSFIVSC